MTLGYTAKHKEVECAACGKRYNLMYQELGVRDKDVVKCDCGAVIKEYNETRMYWIESVGTSDT